MYIVNVQQMNNLLIISNSIHIYIYRCLRSKSSATYCAGALPRIRLAAQYDMLARSARRENGARSAHSLQKHTEHTAQHPRVAALEKQLNDTIAEKNSLIAEAKLTEQRFVRGMLMMGFHTCQKLTEG